MPTGPYRSRPIPDRLPREPQAASGTAIGAAFVWLATVARIAAGLAHGEAASREMVFAAMVLLVAPVIVVRELQRRQRGG